MEILVSCHIISKNKWEQLFHYSLKEPGPITSDFLKLSEILVSEESMYFSHYP